jgi:pyridoxal phosphate enzyme (YggS family)
MLIVPQNSLTTEDLAARYREVRASIAAAAEMAGRNEDCVTLLAVSKGRSATAVRTLARLGVENFGENYLQEAEPKLEALGGMELTWHFIGRLQANKTRTVAERFAWAHGVDRLRIAERLAAQRPAAAAPLNVCVQVKLADVAARSGVSAGEVPALAMAVAALPRLRLRGLMCMLPEGLNSQRQLELFGEVRALFEQLNCHGARLDTLSMGMSGDFQSAIAAGSTMVRIGTALFGAAATTGTSPQEP